MLILFIEILEVKEGFVLKCRSNIIYIAFNSYTLIHKVILLC